MFICHSLLMIVYLLFYACLLGVMGVSNAFYDTKMFLNAELPEVDEYKMRYFSPVSTLHVR